MKKKGIEGEDLAAGFLASIGYLVLRRNYRFKRGEIDIIARKDDMLCFIEVKLRNSQAFGNPETFVSERQQEMIMLAAEQYIYESDWQGDIRFDIVAILERQGRPELEHIKDAFH